MFSDTSGRPHNKELTLADSTFPASQKVRYREYLAARLGLSAPTEDEERVRPESAYEFYSQVYDYLRENTRDAETFKVLLNENITYGYYRNLLGLKPVGIALNLMSLSAAVAIVQYQPEFASLSIGKLVALCGLSALHLMYFLLVVNKRAVLDSSAIYARQLVLSVEILMKQG